MQMIYRLWTITILLILTACAGPKTVHHPTDSLPTPAPNAQSLAQVSTPTSELRLTQKPAQIISQAPQKIILTARSALGTPYNYGGTSLNGFDCSGLTSYAYNSAGISIPRRSIDQFQHAIKVPLHSLQTGDLLFFRLNPPKVSHVAIYDSNGRFIHAPSAGKRVSYGSLDNPYWRRHLYAAGRFN